MRNILFVFLVIISLAWSSFAADENDALPELFGDQSILLAQDIQNIIAFDLKPTENAQPEEALGKRRGTPAKSGLPVAKRNKTVDNLESWIDRNFSEHAQILKEFSELTLAIEHDEFIAGRKTVEGTKTVKEFIREMSRACHNNPILIAFMICLSEVGIESSMIQQYILAVRTGLKTNAQLVSTTASNMHSIVMDEGKSEQMPIFTHTFIRAMRAGLLEFIEKFSDENDFKNFMQKYEQIERLILTKKNKKENKKKITCRLDSSLFPALSLTAEQYYPEAKEWIEKNIADPIHRMAFFSLFDKKFEKRLLIDMIVRSDVSIHNNQQICAICLYLYMFGISSDDIYLFVLYLRDGRGTVKEFSHNRARIYYDNFSEINFDDTPQQYFRGKFSVLLKEVLLPLYASLCVEEFPHQDVIEKLYEKYKKTDQETSKIFSFPSGAIVEDSASIYNNLFNYIESLDAEPDEKEALKSILLIEINNRNLIDEIRALKKSFYVHPLIAALSVYLGHFGVASKDIYYIILKIREGQENHLAFGTTTPGKMFNKYQSIGSNEPEAYFKDQFFVIMKEIFEPLLCKYIGQEARFFNNEYLETTYNEIVQRVEQEKVRLPSKQIDITHYEKYIEKAREVDALLVDWIIKGNIQDKSHQLAFFAVMTTKMSPRNKGEMYFAEIINEIPKSMHGNPYVFAGVIFLKYFGVSSLEIFNFIKRIRGENRIEPRDFGPTKSDTIYMNFCNSKTNKLPKYLSSEGFKKTLQTIMLPLMRELNNNPNAEFLDA